MKRMREDEEMWMREVKMRMWLFDGGWVYVRNEFRERGEQ